MSSKERVDIAQRETKAPSVSSPPSSMSSVPVGSKKCTVVGWPPASNRKREAEERRSNYGDGDNDTIGTIETASPSSDEDGENPSPPRAKKKQRLGGGELVSQSSSSSSSSPERYKEAWERKFGLLRKYASQYGHCNVPQKHPDLGRWVNDQRTNYKKWEKGSKTTLTEERRRLLEGIGFLWSPNELIWNERFEELKAYKKRTGHFNVPQKGNTLGKWVNDQRTQYKKLMDGGRSNLTEARKRILEGIGFSWNAKEANWHERLEELAVYKELHGHTRVPIRENKLGRWVDKQRTEFRRSYLSDERKAKLDELGFVWHLRPKSSTDSDSEN